MKNDAGISAWRSKSRIRGSASTGPNVPWDSVTGSVTPRASHSVSASRSKVNAQAARAPCGQRGAVIARLARAGSGRGRAVPCHGEAEGKPAADVTPAADRRAHRRIGGRPARETEATGAVGRLVPAREWLDERGIVLDLDAAVRIEVGVGRLGGLVVERRRIGRASCRERGQGPAERV